MFTGIPANTWEMGQIIFTSVRTRNLQIDITILIILYGLWSCIISLYAHSTMYVHTEYIVGFRVCIHWYKNAQDVKNEIHIQYTCSFCTPKSFRNGVHRHICCGKVKLCYIGNWKDIYTYSDVKLPVYGSVRNIGNILICIYFYTSNSFKLWIQIITYCWL